MNKILQILWKWQASSKLNSSKLHLQYTAIARLGQVGNSGDIQKLLPYLQHDQQLIRNATARSIKLLLQDVETENFDNINRLIIDRFEDAKKLTDKISIIEVVKALPIAIREIALGPLVAERGVDLQYAIIDSLEGTSDLDILDDVLDASDTHDSVLRHIALQTWYNGIESQEINEVVGYCTPRLHYLIRATYELQSNGAFLKKVLGYANRSELPSPKAYPDFIIRYMTELLGKWKYDPDAYRSLHAIMVPSYFTFDQSSDNDRPFIIL